MPMTTPPSTVNGLPVAIVPSMFAMLASTTGEFDSLPQNRFSFFQTMRRLESLQSDLPRIGYAYSPREERLRIRQSAEMSFAPTTVESIHGGQDDRMIVNQRSFGMFGPAGPLPAHWTELVRNRQRHANDPVLKDFFDLFHHRMACLFYRAWSSARPAVQFDRPDEDRFRRYLNALIGHSSDIQGNDFKDVDLKSKGWQEMSQRFVAGHLSRQFRSTEGLASILGLHLETNVTVKNFAFRWLNVEPEDRSQLRSQKPFVLGKNAMLGSRFPDRTSAIECEIGPLAYSQFQQLAPLQPAFELAKAIYHRYAGPGIDAKLRLVLAQAQVPKPQLGKLGTIGRNVWLCTRPPASDRSDCVVAIPSTTHANEGVC